MSESFAEIEEMIRSLAKDVNPAMSLRQRILTASHVARERQLRRTRVRQVSGWCTLCLCVLYAGAQVPWGDFQTLGGPRGSERSAARGPALNDSQGSVQSTIVSQAEVSSPVFGDPIEWQTADSHWKRRDRQAALLSHYF